MYLSEKRLLATRPILCAKATRASTRRRASPRALGVSVSPPGPVSPNARTRAAGIPNLWPQTLRLLIGDSGDALIEASMPASIRQSSATLTLELVSRSERLYKELGTHRLWSRRAQPISRQGTPRNEHLVKTMRQCVAHVRR